MGSEPSAAREDSQPLSCRPRATGTSWCPVTQAPWSSSSPRLALHLLWASLCPGPLVLAPYLPSPPPSRAQVLPGHPCRRGWECLGEGIWVPGHSPHHSDLCHVPGPALPPYSCDTAGYAVFPQSSVSCSAKWAPVLALALRALLCPWELQTHRGNESMGGFTVRAPLSALSFGLCGQRLPWPGCLPTPHPWSEGPELRTPQGLLGNGHPPP